MWAVYSILIKKYTEQYDNFLVTRRVMLWAFITAVPHSPTRKPPRTERYPSRRVSSAA